MQYKEQRIIVEALPVAEGTTKRFSCFSCGGANTLSVTRSGGDIVWCCFKASCQIKGRHTRAREAGELGYLIRGSRHRDTTNRFTLPNQFVSILNHANALDYVRRYNCLNAYQRKLVDIRYDPKENRIVFLVKRDGETVDAVGRLLGKGTPKWRRYGNSQYPFIVGNNKDIAVVVEDCASACAVVGAATGIALLGTNLVGDYLIPLRAYKELVIALDPDATRKAIALQRKLSFHATSRLVVLQDDLKYCTPQEVAQILQKGGNNPQK
jgi:hypothetical protein